MKLKFMIFVMALAAMGPARDAPPPDGAAVRAPDGAAAATQPRDTVPQRNPARLPPVAQRVEPDPLPDASPLDDGSPQVLDAATVDPDQFLWTARPVVIFADTADDPAFVDQVASLRRDGRALASRDVVLVLDSDPSANSVWRQQLRPQGFSLVLIDKDGQVKIRRPVPWDAREIGRAIDRLPLRRQEIGRGSLMR
ncbi:DUF4174 domain-containing protein [Paracoccus sp. 228]|uniref:DUF4174 domain-containing protein n=1 Tax=Paracoccus sp. 228 TaxID=1192054 RepID=UPI0005DD5C71|nr:DUF4174 domain-containing protein [Paracoccus sp. 228]KIX18988.1 hypothetical protein SY26_02340 [Paracoccus sp. 228]